MEDYQFVLNPLGFIIINLYLIAIINANFMQPATYFTQPMNMVGESNKKPGIIHFPIPLVLDFCYIPTSSANKTLQNGVTQIEFGKWSFFLTLVSVGFAAIDRFSWAKCVHNQELSSERYRYHLCT